MEVMDTLTVCLTSCKFHLGDVPDAWQASYLDDDWEEVLLPHDWSVALPFSAEYSSGTGYLAGGNWLVPNLYYTSGGLEREAY